MKIRSELTFRISLLNTFILQVSSNVPLIVPTGLQIASLNPFHSLIKSDLSSSFSLANFYPFESQLLDILSSWREDTDRYLFSLVPYPSSFKGKEKSSAHILKLATTFFRCYKCRDPISYPRVLMHECLINTNESDVGEKSAHVDQTRQEVEKVRRLLHVDRKTPREPRPPRNVTVTVDTVWPSLSMYLPVGMHVGKPGVTFDEESHNVARCIVEACGEDSHSISYSKMQEKDARLECLRCSRARQGKSRSRPVMSWTMAVSQLWFVDVGSRLSDFILFSRSSMSWRSIMMKPHQRSLLGGWLIVAKTLRKFGRGNWKWWRNANLRNTSAMIVVSTCEHHIYNCI